jgi:hypothetical protein
VVRQVADRLVSTLRRSPNLRLIVLIPRHPDQDGALTGPANRIGRRRALDRVFEAGGDRVAVYDVNADALYEEGPLVKRMGGMPWHWRGAEHRSSLYRLLVGRNRSGGNVAPAVHLL